MKLYVVTANEGRTGMTPQRVRSDMVKIKNRFGRRTLIGWQEIDEDDQAEEHKILGSVFKNYTHAGFSSRVPITVGPSLVISSQGTQKLADGILHASPLRVATIAKVRPRLSIRKDMKFAMVNLHYPAGAFNNKIEPNQKIREERWYEVLEGHTRIVDSLVKQGYTVFWTGDVNRMDMPKVHKRERRLVTAGIDSISVVEGSLDVKLLQTGNLGLYSDHDARFARVELTRKK